MSPAASRMNTGASSGGASFGNSGDQLRRRLDHVLVTDLEEAEALLER